MAAPKRRGLRAVDDPVAGAEASPAPRPSPAATPPAPKAAPPKPASPKRSSPHGAARAPKKEEAATTNRETLFADIDAALKRRLDLAAVQLRLRQRELVELILRDHLDRDDYVERLEGLRKRRLGT